MAYEQPETGIGSVAETNRLLGRNYLEAEADRIKKEDPQSVANFKAANPSLEFGAQDVLPYHNAAISSQSLSGNNSPVVIPPTPISTTAEGISGLAQVQVEQAKLAKEQELRAQEAQKGVTEEKGKLTGLMDRILGVQSSRTQLEEEARIGAKTQKVTDVTNQIEASQRAQTNELRALAGAGLNDVQRAAQAREINRKYAFEQADLALIQSAANRDLDTATRIIDRKIQLQLEPLQTQLDFTKFFYQENKELFTKAEDRAFNAKIKQLDQQYETEKANRTAIANIQLEALKNGVNIPASVMAQLNTAKDAAEATSILARNGISLQNPLDVETKRANLANIYSQIAERNSSVVSTSGVVYKKDPVTGAVIKDATGKPVIDDSGKAQAIQVILGSGTFTKDQKASVINAINNGQDPFVVIKNQAKNIMGQTLATQLDKYETAKAQMVSIDNLLDEYYKSGGKTNIFSGNYEKTINKLGEVRNPKLVEIATNISSALQIYRNAVSGTAYSVQEGKDIASIFPGINKSQGLNEAVLSGRMKAFDTTIDQSYKNTLGSAYNKLKEAEVQVKPEAPKEVNAAYESYLRAIGQ